MFLLTDSAAAQARGTYAVPCQSREVFLSRLRTLLPEPQRAEEALNQFAILIEPDADGSWLMTVSQPGGPEAGEPRTLRQASCSELAEAATLVVSTWASELPPVQPPAAPVQPPAAPPSPAAAPKPPPVRTRPWVKRHMQVGASLNADAALGMMPGASVGGSVAVWFLTADRTRFTSIGVSAWPTHRREDTEIARYPNYERPLWALVFEQTQYMLELEPLRFGVFGGIYVGSRRANDASGNELTSGVTLGGALRCSFGEGPFALRLHLGVSPSWNGRKTIGFTSLAFDVAFN
jgi:hypothetical protein